jgi:hypothetical protein
MSNIMFSSCLTIGDAIAAAGKLKSMLRLTETETSQESQELPRIFLILSIGTVYVQMQLCMPFHLLANR